MISSVTYFVFSVFFVHSVDRVYYRFYNNMDNNANRYLYIGLSVVVIHFFILFGFPFMGISVPYISERTWGYHFIKFYSLPAITIFYIIAIGICIPRINIAINQRIEGILHGKSFEILSKKKSIWMALLSACSIVIFWLLRQKYPFLGDGTMRVNDNVLEKGGYALGLYHYSYIALKNIISLNDATSYLQLTNCILGGIYIYILLLIADLLGKERYDKFLYASAGLFWGIIQFFFGYIEIYGFIGVFILVYFYFSFLAAEYKIYILPAGILLIVSYCAHNLTIMFFPGFALLFYYKIMLKYRIFSNTIFYSISFILMIAMTTLAYDKIISGFILRPFPEEGYKAALFSFSHVIEFLNGQILAAPAGLLLCCISLLFLRKREYFERGMTRFLLLSAGCGIAYAYASNFQRGSLDWDLMMFSGIPVTFLGIHLFLTLSGKIEYKKIALMAVIFSLLNTVPFVVINATDLSIARAEEIISNDPGDTFVRIPPNIFITKILGDAKIDEKALNYAGVAAREYPESPLTHFNLGLHYKREGLMDEAIVEFQKTVEIEPAYAKAYCNLGIIFKDKGMFDEAIQQFQKTVETEPQYAEAYIHLATIYDKMGFSDKAIAQFQKLLEVKPGDATAHYNLAKTYEKRGSIDDAITEYSRAIELYPEYGDAYYHLGKIYDRKESIEAAIRNFKMAAELNPSNADAHYGLGIAYDKNNNLDLAIESYRKSVELKPENAEVHFDLGTAYDRKGIPEGAIVEYQKAIELNPRHAYAHLHLGNSYLNKKMMDNAITHYQKAINSDPSFGDAHANLGIVYFFKRDFISAWKCVKSAQQYGATIDPKFLESLRQAMPEPR